MPKPVSLPPTDLSPEEIARRLVLPRKAWKSNGRSGRVKTGQTAKPPNRQTANNPSPAPPLIAKGAAR